MTLNYRNLGLFGFVGLLLLLEGTVHNEFFAGSWNTMLGIINMGLISAIMALGVNVQWGYAGLSGLWRLAVWPRCWYLRHRSRRSGRRTAPGG
jgi:ABC-type branched-subunit amino acid transport system permease subunit